jgi:hypothetical protein
MKYSVQFFSGKFYFHPTKFDNLKNANNLIEGFKKLDLPLSRIWIYEDQTVIKSWIHGEPQ